MRRKFYLFKNLVYASFDTDTGSNYNRDRKRSRSDLSHANTKSAIVVSVSTPPIRQPQQPSDPIRFNSNSNSTSSPAKQKRNELKEAQWSNLYRLLMQLGSNASSTVRTEEMFFDLHHCAESVQELVRRFSGAIVRTAAAASSVKLDTNTIVDPKTKPDDARKLAQTALLVEQSTDSQILLAKFIFGLIASKNIDCLPAKQKGKKGTYQCKDVSREKSWCQLVANYPRLVCLRELKWSGTNGVHLILKQIRQYLSSSEEASRARTILQQEF
jgi:hypothetical protein